MQRLAGEMMEELSGMGHSADAAMLAADYLSDADNAVALLSQARHWREALRVAYRCAVLYWKAGVLAASLLAPRVQLLRNFVLEASLHCGGIHSSALNSLYHASRNTLQGGLEGVISLASMLRLAVVVQIHAR